MEKTRREQQPQTTTTPATPLTPAPTIAVRKSCNPDGVGLSHYVLLDRKQAR